MNKNGKPTPEKLLHNPIDQFKEALYKQMGPCLLSISKIVNKLFP